MDSLSAGQMEESLEDNVGAALSSRRTATGPAKSLSRFNRAQQDFVLHWVGAIAQTNSEMAFQLAVFAPAALDDMDTEGVEAWIIQAMDSFDKQGLKSGVAALREVKIFIHHRAERVTGLALDEVTGVLQNYIHGLNGRSLGIEASKKTFTDTETLFLPPLINLFGTREENFRVYKAIAVHQWAQTWFGTWRNDVNARASEFVDPNKAIRLYHAVEVIRLDACIAHELPGMYREMRTCERRWIRNIWPRIGTPSGPNSKHRTRAPQIAGG